MKINFLVVLFEKLASLAKEVDMLVAKCCTPLFYIWKKLISPLFGFRCRFHPTCSEYAKQALQKYGFFLGSILAIKRVVRCNSLFSGGIDLLPSLKIPRVKK